MRSLRLAAAALLVVACSPAGDSDLAGSVEAYCRAFAAGLERDAAAGHVLELQYRGRERDIRTARFCAEVRVPGEGGGLPALVDRFAQLAESLRAGLVAQDPTQEPSEEVRHLLREMATTMERINEHPAR
ncbi:MAG: hypothetical protein ACQEXJ_21565 [Myxococcota bacterium]